MEEISTQTGAIPNASGVSLQYLDLDLRECIAACIECGTICRATVPHCLGMGGEHAEVDHIRMLLDCADICQTGANFMSRGSELHARTCRVCAEICDLCAADCERMARGDAQMEACAQACRRCADTCRRMAAS
jgi:hypothetical protein